MILYRFLTDTSVEVLYTAFLAAFADYQVDMRMSLSEFEYRLKRDGVDTSISTGAFLDKQLIGFCLNAGGLWCDQTTVYDAGTGVSPAHRSQGIATQMFNFMLPRLKDLGFTQYLLEVLTSNEAAVNLYRSLGFYHTRHLAVFRSNTPVTSPETERVDIRKVVAANWDLYQSFWSGCPSWQNSIEAVERIAETAVILEAQMDSRCVGYGVVSKTTGNLFQLGVHVDYRRRGIGSALLAALQEQVRTIGPIKINNIDEELKDFLAFSGACGFSLALEQYEMTKAL
jgi:ribosomal protein S18 acetylase RimI-like enzyme